MRRLHKSKSIEKDKLYLGEYYQVVNQDMWAVYKCPACGGVTTLGKKFHDVNYNGLVHPAVRCPHKVGADKCSFSDFLTLEEWVPEAKGSA